MNEKTIRNINNLIKLPTKVAIDKIISKITGKNNNKKYRLNDNNITTYSNSNPIELNNILSFDLERLECYKEQIIELADEFCKHNFNLLGSGLVNIKHGNSYPGLLNNKFAPKLESDLLINELVDSLINKSNVKQSHIIASNISYEYTPIDWQVDFKSGYRWNEKTWYKDISYGKNDGADIKSPWELGRMQQLCVLLYAALFTGNFKYAQEFQNQILDFIAFNPPRFGSQWTTTMDVSIRLSNWLICYNLSNSLNILFSSKFDKIFKISVAEHLDHIMANLEWSSGMRGNHYFAALCSIIVACAYLPVSEKYARYLRFALNELHSEILYQFLPDGGNFEASTSYHRFASEMLFFTLNILDKIPKNIIKEAAKCNSKLKYSGKSSFIPNAKLFNNDDRIEFSEDVKARINKIAEFSLNILNENPPLFGDDDSGYYLRLAPIYNSNDFSPQANNTQDLFELIEKYLANADDKKTNSIELATNYIGKDEYHYFAKEFGLYKFRNLDYTLLFRAGSVGQKGKGGHAHNDALSFTLDVCTKPVLVDPGTYVYTSLFEERNIFRSTSRHNVLQIGEIEQNEFYNIDKNDLFWIKCDKAKAKIIECSEHTITGEHYGYGLPCSRSLKLSDSEIRIQDMCFTKGIKSVFLHLFPGINPVSNENIIEILTDKFLINVEFLTKGEIEICDYYYSSAYGVKEIAKKVVFKAELGEINWKIKLISRN